MTISQISYLITKCRKFRCTNPIRLIQNEIPMHSDQQILDQYLNTGEMDLAVYETFSERAFAALRRQGAAPEVAEDIMQDAWIPFLRKLPVFEVHSEGALFAFYQKICFNKFFTHCNREKRQRDQDKDYLHFQEQWSTDVSSREEDDLKEKKLNYLVRFVEEVMTSKCRKLLHYRYELGLSITAIDDRFDSKNSPGSSSAKTELHRCRKRLRLLMKKVI